MSRRQQKPEADPGSDSFLDIIANIVGILIILIVIAGVKVSRQPIPSSDPSPAVIEKHIPVVVAAPRKQEPDRDAPQESGPTIPLPPEPGVFVKAETPTERSETADALGNARQEVLRESQQLRVAEQTTATLRARFATLSGRLQKDSVAIDRKLAQAADLRGRLTALEQEFLNQRRKAARLHQVLAAPQKPRVKVEQIEHKVTPVGRDVVDNEIHFRLHQGRVSFVPLEQLLTELKRDARRNQRYLLQNPERTGKVGPVRGYEMSYTVRRTSSSLGDDLRYGGATYRVVVSEWSVKPTAELEAETLNQALAPNSLFARRLLGVEPDTNITLWVYPDSFREFRALQKAIHEEGFTVAGRPLPFDVLISGSPNGSRSSAQ